MMQQAIKSSAQIFISGFLQPKEKAASRTNVVCRAKSIKFGLNNTDTENTIIKIVAV